ncbi:MAG: ABC transporter substrate-binding protein, partial [Alphaproteobacteria bacterium]|nr:ABC transporter substrate-binding protein [Alphaproteobacteria bacterium]
MFKKIIFPIIAGAMSLASYAGIASAENIKIGFNVPLTGFAAADGQSALHGAELAVEQVNANGGVNGNMLELVVYDDQASPKEAAPLAIKMITQDDVVAGVSG